MFAASLYLLFACEDRGNKSADDTGASARDSADSGTGGEVRDTADTGVDTDSHDTADTGTGIHGHDTADTGLFVPTAGQMMVLESSDFGDNWIKRGPAQIPGEIHPVDPAPAIRDGQLVLYYFNSLSTEQGAQDDSHCVYRSTAVPGDLDFSAPEVVICSSTVVITDPMPIPTATGHDRLYLAGTGGVASASADGDGVYTLDPGLRVEGYPIPEALLLEGYRVRLFLVGPDGMMSSISNDGINFVSEKGIRLEAPPDGFLGNAHPIRLSNGSFLMVLTIRPPDARGPDQDVVVLADSPNGFDWHVISDKPLAQGSVPGLVELPDGRLQIFYVVTNPLL